MLSGLRRLLGLAPAAAAGAAGGSSGGVSPAAAAAVAAAANAHAAPTAAAAAAVGTSSGSVAKERLSVILASQRGSDVLANVDLKQLRKEVMQIVQKHIQLAEENPISMAVKQEGEIDVFEMQFALEGDRPGHAGERLRVVASSPSAAPAAAPAT